MARIWRLQSLRSRVFIWPACGMQRRKEATCRRKKGSEAVRKRTRFAVHFWCQMNLFRMYHNKGIAMKGILFAVALALSIAFGQAKAVDLPSSITGAYLTPERGCRLELYRWTDPRWTQIDLQCLRWGDGLQTSMLARVFTPEQCPGDIALPFDPRSLSAAEALTGKAESAPGVMLYVDGYWRAMPWIKSGSVEYFSIRSFTASTLSVAVGIDQSALLNGGGIVQTWQQVESIASRSPYTCGSPPVAGGSVRDNCRLNPRAPWCGH